jgi:hypothetical protein
MDLFITLKLLANFETKNFGCPDSNLYPCQNYNKKIMTVIVMFQNHTVYDYTKPTCDTCVYVGVEHSTLCVYAMHNNVPVLILERGDIVM